MPRHVPLPSVTRCGRAIAILCFGLLVWLLVRDVRAQSLSAGLVGGPCEYKQYTGKAEILSVTERPGSPGEYEVKFSFHTVENIGEGFASVEGRQWLLMKPDNMYPKRDFLDKYDIEVGKRLDCSMKVIIRGTCTPILFDFPDIDRSPGQR
jgi:hypothetical protein